jgi:hypothetical protein
MTELLIQQSRHHCIVMIDKRRYQMSSLDAAYDREERLVTPLHVDAPRRHDDDRLAVQVQPAKELFIGELEVVTLGGVEEDLARLVRCPQA